MSLHRVSNIWKGGPHKKKKDVVGPRVKDLCSLQTFMVIFWYSHVGPAKNDIFLWWPQGQDQMDSCIAKETGLA